MHSLTLLCGPTGSTIQFLFRERKDAEKARDSLKADTSPFIFIKDDFGTEGEFAAGSVFARVLEDLAATGDAVIERSLQQAKTQVKAQNRAANDPALKFMSGNGGFPLNHPGSPMGGQRRPG